MNVKQLTAETSTPFRQWQCFCIDLRFNTKPFVSRSIWTAVKLIAASVTTQKFNSSTRPLCYSIMLTISALSSMSPSSTSHTSTRRCWWSSGHYSLQPLRSVRKRHFIYAHHHHHHHHISL